MPKPKKETQKEAHRSFIETIRELRKKVRKELDKNKESIVKLKKKNEPIKAKSIKKKKLQKRKKKNNPNKKHGGY